MEDSKDVKVYCVEIGTISKRQKFSIDVTRFVKSDTATQADVYNDFQKRYGGYAISVNEIKNFTEFTSSLDNGNANGENSLSQSSEIETLKELNKKLASANINLTRDSFVRELDILVEESGDLSDRYNEYLDKKRGLDYNMSGLMASVKKKLLDDYNYVHIDGVELSLYNGKLNAKFAGKLPGRKKS